MKKIFKILLCVMILCCFVLNFICQAAPYTTYTYSYTKEYQVSPDAFVPAQSYISFASVELNKPADVTAAPDGKIFIADSGNNRIVVLNDDYSLNSVISEITLEQGEKTQLANPNGIYVGNDGEIYIADTNNKRIVVLSPDLTLKRIIEEPKTLLLGSDFNYVPVKVCSDKLGRVYVLSRDTPGILLINKDGKYQGCVGAQDVSVDISSYFWRIFMTKEQKQNSKQFVPINYNNLTIDKEGFLFVTSYVEDSYALKKSIDSRSTSGELAPVKRLTPAGIDVLKRNGYFPPVGDILFEMDASSDSEAKLHSDIIDVAVRDNGVYTIADTTYGKLFTYDSEGNMLYSFGGVGDDTGLFSSLVAISYHKTDLLAIDGNKNTLTVFNMTKYGEALDEIIDLQNKNSYSETVVLWEKLLEDNNNLDLAYFGIAKAYYQSGDYESAMNYFKIIDNKEYFSKAFEKKREAFLNKYFLLLPIIIVVSVFVISKIFSKAKKYNLAHQQCIEKRSLKEELIYAFHFIFHPFDGANGLKVEKRAGLKGALILFILAVFSFVTNKYGVAYLFRESDQRGIINAIGNIAVPVLLFCLSNWCLTSLMDGEGTLKNIFIVTSYSLFPIVLIYIPATVVSHFLSSSESAFLSYATGFAILWVLFLIFFSTLTIHNYGLGKNILVAFLSVVGIAIIIFIILLFVSVMGRLTTFIFNLYNEISFRIG